MECDDPIWQPRIGVDFPGIQEKPLIDALLMFESRRRDFSKHRPKISLPIMVRRLVSANECL